MGFAQLHWLDETICALDCLGDTTTWRTVLQTGYLSSVGSTSFDLSLQLLSGGRVPFDQSGGKFHRLLQIVSVQPFGKIPLHDRFTVIPDSFMYTYNPNELGCLSYNRQA